MTRAILFDFNGVLINDEPQHCEALIAALAEYGYGLDRDTYYRDYLGFDDRECFRFTFERMGKRYGGATLAEAIECKADYYERAIRASMTLVPGAADFVRNASAEGLRLAVVSGALRREIDLVLGEAGLREYFHAVVAAEDVSACKPDPQGYDRARKALAVRRERCLVIEDSLPGLAAAQAAGLRCIMLTTSHDRDLLEEAEVVWDDFAGRMPADLPWSHARL